MSNYYYTNLCDFSKSRMGAISGRSSLSMAMVEKKRDPASIPHKNNIYKERKKERKVEI